MSSTPTLDRMLEIKEESQALGEFLEWLRQEYNVRKKEYEPEYVPNNLPSNIRIEDVLAKYYDIDLQQADNEKRRLLDETR